MSLITRVQSGGEWFIKLVIISFMRTFKVSLPYILLQYVLCSAIFISESSIKHVAIGPFLIVLVLTLALAFYLSVLQFYSMDKVFCGNAVNTRQFLKPGVKLACIDCLTKFCLVILVFLVGLAMALTDDKGLALVLGIIMVATVIYLIPILLLVLPVIVIEKTLNPTTVIKRSRQIAHGHRWWIWGQFLLVSLCGKLLLVIGGLLLHLFLGGGHLHVFDNIHTSISFMQDWFLPIYMLYVLNLMLTLYYVLCQRQHATVTPAN